MDTHECIPDELLCKLAEHIETGEQMGALGRKLGFNTAAINRYAETNRLEGRVTSKGTRDMLFDWRQTVEPSNQHPRLKQALIDANLVMLAEIYLKETLANQDTYSEKISESLTVRKCRTILEDKYSNQLCKIQMKPWDKDDYAEFEDMHTVVTMVKKDARGRDIKAKEILQGSVGKIFSAKVNGNLPSRILISAPAGRGKTTAVAKMAHDWVHREDGSGLEDLPLLFVVKFRNTSHTTSIGEAIISQLLNDVKDLTPEGLEEFIRQHQEICHIILDGLDEYAGISSSSNIMIILRREMFPQCRVIVTTRPHLEDIFSQGDLPRVYTKMEIEGFSQENARDYIDRFFTSVQKPMKAGGLKGYLAEQPLIEELVKTPLFCLMVCHLWSEDLLQRDTTTQTALLDQVNIFLMLHANARTPGLIKTPKQLNQIILKLGEIALTGLLNDAKKLVFSSCDFQRVPSILDMACALGIVSKTVVSQRRLPQLDEAFSTTLTIIEFYHKLAQEHAAGKYLADKTNRFPLWLKFSKLDRVLRDIKTSIGEYENLIRFACGTKRNLCIRIMESVLSNSYLSESERYRILLDCSSESWVNDGNVSSLIRRCVTSRRMILKSPTVYTIVGMQNLPRELKQQVGGLRFEQSTVKAAVTDGLWTCLKSFPMLTSLTISDSSIEFPPSPPELPSITDLSAERVTSQCFEGLISSLPALEDIDITIDEAEGDIAHITAGLRRTGRQKLERIILHDTPSSFPSRKSEEGGPRLLFVKNGLGPNMIILQHHDNALHPEKKGPVDVLESFAFLASLVQLKLEFLGGWFFDSETAFGVKITKCQLSPEMTTRIWSCLSSFTSLDHLNISDSSIDFPPSSPELPSITKISTERVTSKCYEGLISSLPALEYIAITIDEAEGDISNITVVLRRTGRQKLERIILRDTPSLFPPRKSPFQNETEGGPRLLFAKNRLDPNLLILHNHNNALNPEKKGPVEVLESFAFLASLAQLKLEFLGGWFFNFETAFGVKITKCQLSPEMTTRIWSCLSSFTSLDHLTISDSSISFPPSRPEVPSIRRLSVEKVTSQCLESLISSLPGLTDMVYINGAEGNIAQITFVLRQTGVHKLERIILRDTPSSFPSRKSGFRGETKGGPRLLFDKSDHSGTATIMLIFHSARHMEKKGPLEVLESFAFLASLAQLKLIFRDGWSFHFERAFGLKITKCQLSLEMTTRIWSCLSSFTSLNHLTISDSSIDFPPSSLELPSITKLSAERVTSKCYEGLISSLPALEDIDIIIDEADMADEDIVNITAGLRRTGGQKLTWITLQAPLPLPSERKTVSSETMRGLGLLIKEHTKNLDCLILEKVKCADEDDLVCLIECCRHVKTMNYVALKKCGTMLDGRVASYLKRLDTASCNKLHVPVYVFHDDCLYERNYWIPNID